MYGTSLYASIQYADFNRKLDYTRVIDNHTDNTFTSLVAIETNGGQDKSTGLFTSRVFATSKKQIGTPREIPVTPCDC